MYNNQKIYSLLFSTPIETEPFNFLTFYMNLITRFHNMATVTGHIMESGYQNHVTGEEIERLLFRLVSKIIMNIFSSYCKLFCTSCTLRALLRLQFNLNETRYFVLIVFIEVLLNI
jgi:hypothetical protein